MTHPLSPRALLVVAVGGALGALGRYGIAEAFPVASGTFPTTTFLVNVGGAFALAFLLEVLQRRGAPEHWLRLLVGVGVLGAFTTFSAMATEIALLWRGGDGDIAVVYAATSVVAGVAAVFAGLVLAGFRAPPVPEEDEA